MGKIICLLAVVQKSESSPIYTTPLPKKPLQACQVPYLAYSVGGVRLRLSSTRGCRVYGAEVGGRQGTKATGANIEGSLFPKIP